MRKKIILHIGHGKTGSSAIQSSLALSADRLLQRGIAYPHHSSFETARQGGISSGNLDTSPYFLDEITRHLAVRPESTIVFSNENMFYRAKRMLEAVGKLTTEHDVIAFLFLRNPLELLESFYGQKVKRGGYFGSIDDFSLQDSHLSSARQIVLALDQMGCSVVPRNYSTIKDRVVPEFFQMLGLGPDFAPAMPDIPIVNRSLTQGELTLQRAFNRHYGSKSSHFISDPLVEGLPLIEAEHDRLSKQAYDHYVERIASDVDYLNSLLPAGEQIVIEPHQNGPRTNAVAAQTFSDAQIDILARSLSNRVQNLERQIAFLQAKKSRPVGLRRALGRPLRRLVRRIRG